MMPRMQAYHSRHDLGNHLTIALANIEAMLDGIAEVTPERLEAIAGALRKANEIVRGMEPPESTELTPS
jgi:hypothetical protein